MFLNLSLLLLLFTEANSARILGIFHIGCYSHQRIGTKLLFGLASRGHEVTMLTPILPKYTPKNVTVIQANPKLTVSDASLNIFEIDRSGIHASVIISDKVARAATHLLLNDSNVQIFLQSNRTFDVVVIDHFETYAITAFCHHYQALCVFVSTIGPTYIINEIMGNPSNPSYMPNMPLKYSPNMKFYQRLYNTYASLFQQMYFQFYSIEKHNEIMQKYFPGSPHLREIFYNTSLVLLNSHCSVSNAVPNVPNIIEIGGYHIDPPKKLPDDIQQYLDEATEGVIYFSMGSILKVAKMHKKKLEVIVNSFGKLKQNILWVVDGNISDLPPNVKTMKWAPQMDVLAHPNIQVFVSHGGLLGTTEAIYCGVPILAIPVFADQGVNAAHAEYEGYGIAVPYKNLDEESFSTALNAILTNPKYRDNAKQRSMAFHDQPMKPLEKALFWVEYVIRHKGAPHLRTAALNLTWYQYLQLDVWLAVTSCISLILFMFCKVCRILFETRSTLVREGEKEKKQ